MEKDMDHFLAVYHEAMYWGTIGFIALAFLIILIHWIKFLSIKEFKDKHDYLNEKEIKHLKYASYSLGVAVFMLVNLYAQGIEFDKVWFLVRLFISLALGTMFTYINNLILQYYYPSKLDSRLKKWRYMPRINPKTGNKMRLLSEEEEDVHLDEGMQAEEEAFSVDYDVWIDEETGDTKIEKYAGHLEALQCNNCGFFTMKVVREEIVAEPTNENDGELIKHYECTYCGSIRATQFHIAKLQEDYSHFDPSKVKYDDSKSVRSVKIEIVATDGHKKNYVFQNVDQATKFLEEFDYERVSD